MGRKYIIELEDENYHQYSDSEPSDYLWRVKGFDALVFDEVGISKLTPYTEPDLEQVRKEAYEEGYAEGSKEDYDEAYLKGYNQGLADAWEAARKIVSMTNADAWKIFDCCDRNVVKQYTAQDVIEKLKAYEQKQEEIKVGDEVKSIESDWTAIVTKSEEGHLTLMGDSGAIANGYDAKYFAKTGRHFPEIAAVLEKMRETNDG